MSSLRQKILAKDDDANAGRRGRASLKSDLFQAFCLCFKSKSYATAGDLPIQFRGFSRRERRKKTTHLRLHEIPGNGWSCPNPLLFFGSTYARVCVWEFRQFVRICVIFSLVFFCESIFVSLAYASPRGGNPDFSVADSVQILLRKHSGFDSNCNLAGFSVILVSGFGLSVWRLCCFLHCLHGTLSKFIGLVMGSHVMVVPWLSGRCMSKNISNL